MVKQKMTTDNWYPNPSVFISVAKSFQFLIPSLESCFDTIAKFPDAVPCAHTCKSDLVSKDGWIVHHLKFNPFDESQSVKTLNQKNKTMSFNVLMY